MSITLRSSVGGFDEDFIRRLPSVEGAMAARGLIPSHVTIIKDRALADPPNWTYTIVLGDERCRVMQPDDMTLLNYVEACCRTLDDESAASQLDADSEHLGARLLQWMELLADAGS
jgi:hypothetical protein